MNECPRTNHLISPSLFLVRKCYRQFAELECAKRESPSPITVDNHLTGLNRLCALCGLGARQRLDTLTPERLEKFLVTAHQKGLSGTSIASYLSSLKSVFARWTLPYWRQAGYLVPHLEIPFCARHTPHYERPDPTTLMHVKKWYLSLSHRADPREWMVATLMLEFGLRNGDVARLNWSNFSLRTIKNAHSKRTLSQIFLNYMPHKTALSSARHVNWPVHPKLWKKIEAYRMRTTNDQRAHSSTALRVVPFARSVMDHLNADLRQRELFVGSKGLYELRKICIDHVYQHFGAEMASSISGDDIQTVTHYYADPSAVHQEGVRILDLL